MYRGDTPGYVVLDDGTVFTGYGFGSHGRVLGEVVFNTGMTGYQEIVTDPSYHGQMVTYTYPMIGNYGASDHLLESDQAHSRAIVVREVKNTAWNGTCPEAWVDWLTARGIVGVAWGGYPGADQAHTRARGHDGLRRRRGWSSGRRPPRRGPLFPRHGGPGPGERRHLR